MKEVDKSLDSQLWHACAGGMVQMPLVNSKVFYFPQGHAEHAHANVDFGVSSRIPALILCRVVAIKFMADPETDEVFAKLKLVPSGNDERDYEDDGVSSGSNGSDATTEKPTSFAKTLTQSDANNGGGFSVPRYCAETIFPRLDYSADPPVQTIIAKDVHGEVWKFRHIYRGTPRRHLLTTGWSTFVNQKKLVAGDSIVFLRAENGDLCVGIRRAKRGIGGGGPESPSGWNPNCVPVLSSYGGFTMFLRDDDNKLIRNNGGGSRGSRRVMPEFVAKAAASAANGQPFEVVFFPRASTPEFCVKASAVSKVVRIQWCSGMRFKMAFETEDSSRISWFMGTISSVQVADPIRWPNSPWRLLQVAWDEPDLLQNVKRVSPWLVELVSNMPPIIHLSPFSPSRKKLRLLQHSDFPPDGPFPMPSYSGNNPLGSSSPVCYLSDNTPAGIQGARHAQYGISLSGIHINNELQSEIFPSSFKRFDPHPRFSGGIIKGHHKSSNENISCLLTIGNSNQNLEKTDKVKTHQFLLFGQPILTEQQIYNDAFSEVLTGKKSSEEANVWSNGSRKILDQLGLPKDLSWHQGSQTSEDTGICKVFFESENVGRSLDLSVLASYEDLHRALTNMFGIERFDLRHVIYRDTTGALKRTGDEPFSDFMKTAKELTVQINPNKDSIGWTWMTGLRNAENGLDSSTKAGPLSIFA